MTKERYTTKAAILTAMLLASLAMADTVNFDNLATGAPPPGWTATKTGTGSAKWSIERDDTAPSKPNVLKQSGQATYPVCIKDDTNLKDGFVEVKFKPISGKEDQAGGVIWRARDSNNYYVARANALEDNVGVMAAEKTAIAILSIPDGKLLGQIKLPGKPQGFIVEQKGKRIFANIPALKQVVVMDRESRKLLEPWSLAGTQGNYPIDLDEDSHRLFVGCRQPPRMVVLDTASGKAVANIEINGDTDDLFYDPVRRRVYVSSGDGSIDVIDQRDANHYVSRGRVPTVEGARTSTLSAVLNLFCLGVPRRGTEPAELRVFQGQK